MSLSNLLAAPVPVRASEKTLTSSSILAQAVQVTVLASRGCLLTEDFGDLRMRESLTQQGEELRSSDAVTLLVMALPRDPLAWACWLREKVNYLTVRATCSWLFCVLTNTLETKGLQKVPENPYYLFLPLFFPKLPKSPS